MISNIFCSYDIWVKQNQVDIANFDFYIGGTLQMI